MNGPWNQDGSLLNYACDLKGHMEKYGTAKRIEQKKIDVHYSLCLGGQGWGLNFPLSIPLLPAPFPSSVVSTSWCCNWFPLFVWFLPPWEFYFPLSLIPPPVEFSSPGSRTLSSHWYGAYWNASLSIHCAPSILSGWEHTAHVANSSSHRTVVLYSLVLDRVNW